MKTNINSIFVYLPNWLGDAVMSSAAIACLRRAYPSARFTFYGSAVACDIFRGFDGCEFVVEDKSRRFRQFWALGAFDLGVCLKGSLSAKMCFWLLKARRKLYFDKRIKAHQVEKYAACISSICDISHLALHIPYARTSDNAPTSEISFVDTARPKNRLGINPGAKYGSAKRWEAEYFAAVAREFASTHEIYIYGVPSESDICQKIFDILRQSGISAHNLCSRTSIKELCEHISSLDLFVTNDSGPMHIAAAYGIKTIAIFGPTRTDETSPYSPNARIIKLELDCMPCMKRACPLSHHRCMTDLRPSLVIDALHQIKESK